MRGATRSSAPTGIPTARAPMLLLLGASTLYSLNFAMLLPVAPVLVERVDYRGIAGLVNTALLVATVTVQWVSPMLLRHVSKQRLFLIGTALMGLPSLAYILLADSLSALFIASVVRGAGFGILTVVSAALLMEQAAPERRGRVLGWFGLATSVPAVFGPALGLQLVSDESAGASGVVALVACGLAAVLAWKVKDHGTGSAEAAMPRSAVMQMLRSRELLGYALAFTLVSVAWGGTVSFLPLTLDPNGLASAATFLFISGLLRAAGRWFAGFLADWGMSPARLSAPLILLMAAGLTVLAVSQSPTAVIVAAVLYGTGLGVFQTMLLLAMIQKSPYGYSAASALWATSLDIGGVIGTGVLTGVAAVGGYSAVLWAMPLIMVAGLPIALSLRRVERAAVAV